MAEVTDEGSEDDAAIAVAAFIIIVAGMASAAVAQAEAEAEAAVAQKAVAAVSLICSRLLEVLLAGLVATGVVVLVEVGVAVVEAWMLPRRSGVLLLLPVPLTLLKADVDADIIRADDLETDTCSCPPKSSAVHRAADTFSAETLRFRPSLFSFSSRSLFSSASFSSSSASVLIRLDPLLLRCCCCCCWCCGGCS